MAKGIFAFGTLVGKLGDVIYYRSGGQQHSRPRIRKPKNPQTNKQLFQRARFSAAGMFYSHGRQAFFPYSFEDKKQNESYFNAFMRNNTHLAYPVSKSVVNNVSYPILQNWVVTKGSLPTIEAYRHSPDNGNTIGLAFNFPLYSSQTSINTMADLSRALIATGDFDNGDILTFLTILTDMRLDATAYGLYPEIVPVQSRSARWFIRQFNVNTSDTTQLSSYNIAATITDDNEVRVNVWGYNTSWWPNQLAGGTIVHSRVKGSRTQVSTQALVLSEVADEQINSLLVQNYAEYVDAVINNWRTSEQDIVIQPTEILQGSNSINFNFQPEPEPTTLPLTSSPVSNTFEVPAGGVVNDSFTFSPKVSITAGTTLKITLETRVSGFSTIYTKELTFNPWDGESEELRLSQTGQPVTNYELVVFDESTYLQITSGRVDYLELQIGNNGTTQAVNIVSMKSIRVINPNGTYTDYVVQS